MEIIRTTVSEETPCNFCKRGTLTEDRKALQYPYEEVIVVSGRSIAVVYCEECFNELKSQNFRED